MHKRTQSQRGGYNSSSNGSSLSAIAQPNVNSSQSSSSSVVKSEMYNSSSVAVKPEPLMNMSVKEANIEKKGSGDSTNSRNNSSNVTSGSQNKMQNPNESSKVDPYAVQDCKKKFTGRCRLFFGNMPLSFTEEDFIKALKPYGECEDLFLNPKKGFGFVKLETRAAAEACKNGLDGIELQGRTIRVRFATHSAALQVKNLSPHCTNELLTEAFSQFGEVERAVVIVDDRGKSTGTGIVEFSRRNAYTRALDTITNGVFFISKTLRPLTVEPLEQRDEEDGLPEKYAFKNNEFYDELSAKPRFADPGTVEYEIGLKWKDLERQEADRKVKLEEEMLRKRTEMELDIESIIADHKATMLRQDLLKRQAELQALEAQKRHIEEQKRREMEMRMAPIDNNRQPMPGPGAFPNQMARVNPMNRGSYPPGSGSPAQNPVDVQRQQQGMREYPMKAPLPAQVPGRPMMPPPNPPFAAHEPQRLGNGPPINQVPVGFPRPQLGEPMRQQRYENPGQQRVPMGGNMPPHHLMHQNNQMGPIDPKRARRF